MPSNWNSRGKTYFNGRHVLGIWVPPPSSNIPYRYYEIEGEDIGRLDLISYKVYGSEEHFWVIASFNAILDPFSGFFVGQTIKVPDLHAYLKEWQSYGYNPRPM